MTNLIFKSRKWWKSDWDLYAGEKVIGSFSMKGWSYTRAAVHIGTKQFEITYKGWSGNRTQLCDASGKEIATAEPINFWGTRVEIRLHGRKYILTTSGWMTHFLAMDEQGHELVRLKDRWWSNTFDVTIKNPDAEVELLLAFLLLYRGIQMRAASSGT